MLCVESLQFLKVGRDFPVPYGFKPQTVVLFLFLVFSDFYRLSSHKKIQIQIFANEKFQIFQCQKHMSKKQKSMTLSNCKFYAIIKARGNNQRGKSHEIQAIIVGFRFCYSCN